MKPWFRLNADFPLDGALRETGFAWAWPFLLAAWKRSSVFGRLSDTDLSDRVLHEVAQVPGCPAGRSFTIRDAYIAVGLITPGEDGGWTTPSWEDYQEDPTKADRQQRYREHNRERIAEADRRRYAERTGRAVHPGDVPRRSATSNDVVGNENDVPTTSSDAQRRTTTPDGTGRDRELRSQEQTTCPTSGQTAGVEDAEPETPAIRTQAELVFRHWVAVCRKSGLAAKLSTTASKKRIGHVVARLRDGYTVDQLKLAVDGCAKSPFHQGQNDRSQVYDDLELICRPGKVDQFIQLAAAAAPRAPAEEIVPTSTRRTGNTDPIPDRSVWEYRNRLAAQAAGAGSGRP